MVICKQWNSYLLNLTIAASQLDDTRKASHVMWAFSCSSLIENGRLHKEPGITDSRIYGPCAHGQHHYDHSSLPQSLDMASAHVKGKTLAMAGVETGHKTGLFSSPTQVPLCNHSHLPQTDSFYTDDFFLAYYSSFSSQLFLHVWYHVHLWVITSKIWLKLNSHPELLENLC